LRTSGDGTTNWTSYKDHWKSNIGTGDNSNFNMAILYLFRLNDLLERCSVARYQRNQLLWFTALHEVWVNISWKVAQETDSDRVEGLVNERFAKVQDFFSKCNINDLEIQSKSVGFAEKELHEVSKMINILLYNYGLLMPFPKKKFRSERAVDSF